MEDSLKYPKPYFEFNQELSDLIVKAIQEIEETKKRPAFVFDI